MEKLMETLNKVGKDKLMHFFVGFFIYIVMSMLIPNWLALLVVVLVAATKELYYDKKLKKGTPEVLDFVFTIIPGMIMLLIR